MSNRLYRFVIILSLAILGFVVMALMADYLTPKRTIHFHPTPVVSHFHLVNHEK